MANINQKEPTVSVSNEILQSLDKCISLSKSLETISFRIHLGDPAKEIQKVSEAKPVPDSFSYVALDKISIISYILTTVINNLEEFITVKN